MPTVSERRNDLKNQRSYEHYYHTCSEPIIEDNDPYQSENYDNNIVIGHEFQYRIGRVNEEPDNTPNQQ